MSKVSIIGAGKLGSKIAYTIAQRGIADDVVIVDILTDVARGNAMDISQSIAHVNDTSVVSGGYEAISGSDIVVITAGKPRTPDMKDRLELARVNANIVSSVCESVRKHAPDCIVITCSNPMDLMNHVAFKKLGFSKERVIGFGGRLDGARLKYIIAKHLGVKMSDVEADVIGEHGQSMVPVFSRVMVNDEKHKFSESEKEKITAEVRGIALEIITLKGITDFAPASCVADMVDAILNDTGIAVPCSMNDDGVSIGVPVELGCGGAKIIEWKLSADEKKMFDEGKEKLKGMASSL
ncbi:MAG: 3-hydroxyacyl-CoA dehydrogenase NAD-binding domain-containing protein [archaeon]